MSLAHAHPGSTSGIQRTAYAAPRLSKSGILAVLAAHAALLGLAIHLDVLPSPVPMPALMVSLLPAATAAAQPTPSEPPPPRAKPTPAMKPQPSRTLTTNAPSPATTSAPPEPPPAAPPVAPAPAAPAPVSPPRFDADYLKNPAPNYPPMSRRMGEEGKVLLRVFVDAGGRPTQIEIKSSSGSPRLDQAASEAVWRWQFVPARQGDEARAAWVVVPIVFTLKG
ncbi:energy transducer TonB [Rhodocyclus gracilis]|uniref:energy transducer TonB n=1 Tax=Rhodocyclus gracilis TaxID=2929842 RepID=UPI001E4A0A2C|nr:energy transducer TonB [Rhodocyclus gracilis]